jgi:hypothetical protein
VSIVAGQWVSKDAAIRQCNRISPPPMAKTHRSPQPQNPTVPDVIFRDSHDAWILLEADPEVRSFCERPAYVVGEAGRLIDFWVDRRRQAKFWILSGGESEADGLPSTLHGIAVRVLHRADMIAAEMRIKNRSQIVPYLISFRRHINRRLQEEIFARVEKPHRLEHIEAAFQPIDVSVVRASLFTLVAEGRVVAPDIDVVLLGPTTVFRRSAS